MRSCLPLLLFVVPVLEAQEKTGPKPLDLSHLIAKLNSKKEEACLYALQELLDLGDKAAPAVEALIPLLETPHEEIRVHTALALGKIGKPAIAPLLKKLAHKDAEVRFYAVWSLGLMGAEAASALDRVLPLMADKDAGVRRKTIYTLGRMKAGGKKTMQILVEALADEPDIRSEAAEALVERGAPAIEFAHRGLASDNETTREASAKILFQLAAEHKEAIPYIVDALFHRQRKVRSRAARALRDIDVYEPHTVLALARAFREAGDDDDIRKSCMQALLDAGPAAAPAMPTLLETLYDEGYYYAHLAWRALENCGHDPRPMLTKRLNDPDASVRLATAGIFLIVADDKKTPVPVLVALLEHASLRLRLKAAILLARTGSEVKKLCAALEWMTYLDDAELRYMALMAVSYVTEHDAKLASMLIPFLKDPDPKHRSTAVSWLRWHKGKDLERAALSCLDDPDAEVRYATILTFHAWDAEVKTCYPAVRTLFLGELGPRVFNDLARNAKSKDWVRRLIVLGLDDKQLKVRQGFVQIAHDRATADPDVMDRLGQLALKDADDGLRYRAIKAMIQAGNAALPKVLECFRSEDARVRKAAATAFTSDGVDKDVAAKALIGALKDKSALVRGRAAWALGHYGREAAAALPVLRELLRDSDADVREQAAEAIKSIELRIGASR